MLLCPPCLLYHDGLYPLELRTHINLPSLKLLLLRLFVKVMRKATHIVISIEIHSTCFCQELWLECCWTLSPEFHVLESGGPAWQYNHGGAELNEDNEVRGA